ncbi:MAG: YncE family protein, partial [Chloroflexi bacterium]
MGRRWVVLVALVLAACAIAIARAASSSDPNAVGPNTGIQPNGRRLAPPGKLTPIGNHPGGGALTANSHFLWTLSAGRGKNDIRIVRVQPEVKVTCKKKRVHGHKVRKCRKVLKGKVGAVVQIIPMPGVDGGIAMAADGRTAYVSGNKDSDHKDEQVAANVPGKEGDVIHVFHYDRSTGIAQRAGIIPVPPPSGSPTPQNFPPTNTKKLSWPRDLAVTPNGRTLLAALNLADRAAIVDTVTKTVQYVQTGSYPYGAAITRDGKGLVSNESNGTVSVIDLGTGTKIKDIQVGNHLSHPEGIAVDPKEDRAYVAVASEDKVVEIDTKALAVKHDLLLQRPQGVGTEPTQVSVSRDGCYLTSADSGEDAVAVYRLRSGCPPYKKAKKRKRHSSGSVRGKALTSAAAPHVTTALPEPQLLARVPTAAYPVMASVVQGAKSIAWISAKGLGVGPNPNGPNPLSTNDSDNNINSFQYLPSIVDGAAGVLPFPTPKQFGQYNAQALAQVRPANGEQPPPGTPITAPGPGQKIQHVFYIVRENRTYDQVLGDDPRGNGDPHLELFPSNLTPNAHALAKRFPLL